MILNHFVKDPHKRKKIAHIAAAVTILVHAYENYETRHHSYELFTIAGIIVLVLAIFHSSIEKRAPWIDGVFLVIEGILSLIISIDHFRHGKKALPVVYLLLSFFQFFMAFRRGKKGIAQHQSQHQVIIEEEKK